MPDSQLVSVHLEGMPRRESFRVARELVRAACGEVTLGGVREAELKPPGAPVDDGPTLPDAPAAGMGFYLRDGEHLHCLSLGVNTVGRLPDNDVVIRDEHVSRRHCAIVVHRDGRAEVYDVASKNGTVLNGKKINGPTRLHTGDQLTLCTRSVVFLTRAGGPTG